MTKRLCTLLVILTLVFSASSVAAEKTISSSYDQFIVVRTLNCASWLSPANLCSRDWAQGVVQEASVVSSVVIVPSVARNLDGAANTTINDRELSGTQVLDENLGRVSGGAVLFATPDVARQTISTIILWDEVKPRFTQYEHGSGQIISSTSVVQFK